MQAHNWFSADADEPRRIADVRQAGASVLHALRPLRNVDSRREQGTLVAVLIEVACLRPPDRRAMSHARRAPREQQEGRRSAFPAGAAVNAARGACRAHRVGCEPASSRASGTVAE
jgi:hypothetical protein